MAEQLRLHKVSGDRPAVDRDERSPLTRAVLVDRPRDHLFAGAAFAEDQDVGVHRGGPSDVVANLEDRLAPPNDSAEDEGPPKLAA